MLYSLTIGQIAIGQPADEQVAILPAGFSLFHVLCFNGSRTASFGGK